MSADFLLEILSEEIPARMQDKAREDLARLFGDEIARAGLKAAAIETFATPRRLALVARALPLATEAVSEEIKGPRTSAPPQALDGFLRKTGLTKDALVERDGVWFALIDKPGRATVELLAEAIPAMIRAFPWPKAMRWGAASSETTSLRWVRPLQGIVALLGEDVVPFEVAGIRAGSATVGHRFHHPGQITIGSAADYAAKLNACHVIVDRAERRAIIRTRAAALAAEAGLTVAPDEGLVAENAGLTEWPVPILGRFDPAFLEVPPEVIQLTMRTNQKYFALNDAAGRLAPNFICTANIEAADGGAAIAAGNARVLAARLSDAKFFWEQDRKIPLADQAAKLDKIVFHEKLGTVADKVERVARLARWLVEEGIVKGADPQMAEDAAKLAKADLVTGMVGEFPELQGIMGGYYARAQGLPPQVADAIRDHYKPVGQGDEVPTAPVTVAVSLADKLDSLAMFFAVEIIPTGSRDPFALRRAALGVIELVARNVLRLPLERVAQLPPALAVMRATFFEDGVLDASENVRFSTDALGTYRSEWDLGEGFVQLTNRPETAINFEDVPVSMAHDMVDLKRSPEQLLHFFADRLKVQQREAGVRHDLIDAVFALGGEDDLVRLLARVKALQAFVATPEGADLLAGYRRAANILKKEGWDAAASTRHPGLEPGSRLSAAEEAAGPRLGGRGDDSVPEHPANKSLSYTPETEEAALIAALDSAEPAARDAVAAEDFEGAMAALAGLRGPIDAFFDKVTVNDSDPVKREARLDLLARIRAAVHAVADFSKIEG